MRFFIVLTLVIAALSSSGQYKHDSLKTDKGYLHYYVRGTGKPVVFLQGGPGFSHYYMRAVADSMTDIQCILIDYQGTGRSKYTPPGDWVSNDKIVDDLEMVRNKMKIEKWTLVGHSYGAMFAFNYAVKKPEHTEKVITISSAGTNNEFQKHFGDNILSKISLEERKLFNDLRSRGNTGEPDGMGEADMIFLKGYFYNPDKIKELFAPVPEIELTRFFNGKFHNAYWSNTQNRNFDITAEVLNTEIPVRMIESWQDPCYDGRQWVLNEKLKNSKINFINKSGHFPWVEQPAVFYNLLRELVRE